MKKHIPSIVIFLCAIFLATAFLPSIEYYKSNDSAVAYITLSASLVIIAMSGMLVMQTTKKSQRIAMFSLIVLCVYRLVTAMSDLYRCYEFYLTGKM